MSVAWKLNADDIPGPDAGERVSVADCGGVKLKPPRDGVTPVGLVYCCMYGWYWEDRLIVSKVSGPGPELLPMGANGANICGDSVGVVPPGVVAPKGEWSA